MSATNWRVAKKGKWATVWERGGRYAVTWNRPDGKRRPPMSPSLAYVNESEAVAEMVRRDKLAEDPLGPLR